MVVDLGWRLWRTIEIQYGADDAALAEVVYETNSRAEAHAEVMSSALQNGFDDGAPRTSVSVLDFLSTDNTAVANNSKLRVTMNHNLETFFLTPHHLERVDRRQTRSASSSTLEYSPSARPAVHSTTSSKLSRMSPGRRLAAHDHPHPHPPGLHLHGPRLFVHDHVRVRGEGQRHQHMVE